MRTVLLHMHVILLAGAVSVSAATIPIEDFTTGLNGWTSFGTETHVLTGGVGDSPYMEASRSSDTQAFAPAHLAPASLLGDLDATYGQEFVIRFSVKAISSNLGWVNQIRSDADLPVGNPDGVNGRWDFAVFNSGDLPADWTEVTVPFDTNWTDEEANAAGWQRTSGDATWSATVRSVDQHAFGFGIGGAGPATVTTGLDEVNVDTGTLPTGACCLPAGGCSDTSLSDCVTVEQGLFLGMGTACAGVTCPDPSATKVYYEGFEPGNVEPFESTPMYPDCATDPLYCDWPQPPIDQGEWEEGFYGNWDDGTGVYGAGATAANGNTGFIYGVNAIHPSKDGIAKHVFSNGNDLAADFGAAFVLKCWVKQLDGVDDGLFVQLRGTDDSGGGRWNYWVFQAGETPTEWTEVLLPFDSGWTDAQAVAAGWVREQGGTFSSAVQAVYRMTFNYPGGGGNIGIDEVMLRAAEPGELDGACCLPDNTCQITTASECTILTGYFEGVGTTCDGSCPTSSLTAEYYEGFEPGGVEPFESTAMYPECAVDPQYCDWPQPPIDQGEWEEGFYGTWDDGTGIYGAGATATNGNTGFIYATGGMPATRDGAALAVFTGDMAADFGDAFEIVFWLKQLDGTDDGFFVQLRGTTESGGARWNYWVYQAGQTPTEWTQVTVPFDVSWNTEALANANGWLREQGSTFDTGLQDVAIMTFGYPSGGGNVAIDEVRVGGTVGACCLDNGQACQDGTTADECLTLGGVYQGDGTVCAQTTCCPDPFADADYDGDVDQADFGAFQACFTGVDGGILPGCECFNVHPGESAPDDDVDEDDLDAFEACASGPGVPADPSCDDGL